MDRNNGGDPLAPPRPPKLLPRVHRPRAPEPTMMSESNIATTAAAAVATEIPQCTNTNSNNINNNNNNNNSSSRHIISNSNSSLQQQQQQQHFNSITNLNNSSSNNNVAALNTQNALHPHHQQHSHHHQHHHLTTPLLQLHPSHQRTPATTTTNLSRNNSNLSNISSASTSVTAANSFTRRRPLPPTPPTTTTVGFGNANVLATTATTASPSSIAAAAVPLLTVVNGNILSGSFLHSNDPPARPASPPVTLAAPRPESERLTNEYVDTPFRTAQQLQHASRTQHPAGQAVRGQTTTQHSLLRQQSQNRQQQHQQQQQQHQHSSRVGTAGSATTTATQTATNSTTPAATVERGSDQLDAFLHSNSSHKTTHATTTTPTTGKSSTLSNSQPPTPPARPHATTAATLFNNTTLPITQPITKQPASANNNTSSNTFTKDQQHHQQHPAFNDDILDLHHIGGLSTPPGAPGSNSNTLTRGSTATPIMIGAGSDVAALNPITCPRCERCRCEQCQSPRQLPQTWVCNKTCLCSAETIIDYASCLCCVKALFYHCAKDHEELDCDDGATTLCVDDPCSCLPHKRAQRWGWLGALSLVLPCLWCYWPMRGCVAICEKCYGRFAGHGCRCQQIGSTSSMLPIVPLGIGGGGNNGSGGGGLNGGGGGNALNGTGGNNTVSGTKAVSGGGHQHHQRHHSECSAAQRILRKCDLTPEKRLLDSSPEY